MNKRRGPEPEADAQDVLAKSMTEEELLVNVRDAAKKLGWLDYHTRDSRRSSAGFPDLVMVRRGVVIFAELKSAKGYISDDQHAWLAALEAVHHKAFWQVAVYVWRPENWMNGDVERALR